MGDIVTSIDEIIHYTNELLKIDDFQDYAPNGLQIAGKIDVRKIVCGVSANLELIEQAIAKDADLLLVHHGYFWNGEAPAIVGIKHRRIKTLLTHDINLLAYHLPLDAHPVYGNNVQLAEQLGIVVGERFGPNNLLFTGLLKKAMTAQEFSSVLEKTLNHKPLHISRNPDTVIHKIGWCTGGAQDLLELAASCGCDAYVSGEISERTTHNAYELGIEYFAAGHHATERYGVQALGLHLAEKFALDYEFIEIANPV